MTKMSLTELRTAIRNEIIKTLTESAVAEDSKASAEAKQKGLEYMSFGRYGKDGQVTHRSVNGKLQPVDMGQAANKSGLAMRKDKTAFGTTAQAYTAGRPDKPFDGKNGNGGQAVATPAPGTTPFVNRNVAAYDPAKGRFNSLTAPQNKTSQDLRSKTRDAFGTDNRNDPLVKGLTPHKPLRSAAMDKARARISDKYAQSPLAGSASELSKDDFLQQSGLSDLEFRFMNASGNNEDYWEYDPDTDMVYTIPDGSISDY